MNCSRIMLFCLCFSVLLVSQFFSGDTFAAPGGSCSSCTQNAIDNCEGVDPAQYMDCLDSSFTDCVEFDCCGYWCDWECADECWMFADECHTSCDTDMEICIDDCATMAVDDCKAGCDGGDQPCLDSCDAEYETYRMGCEPGCDPAATLCHDSCDSDLGGCEQQCSDDCDMCMASEQPDWDGDTITGSDDNCPLIGNTDQTDSDGDTVGDVCDNCPGDSNADQQNTDNDCWGDACDSCAAVFTNDQADGDADGLGDACDPDIDDDTVANGSDNCPFRANSDQADSDGDGFGDVCDTDLPLPGLVIKDIVSTIEPMSQQVNLDQPSPFYADTEVLPDTDFQKFWAMDVSSSGGSEKMVGWVQEGCKFTRCGTFLGEDRASDPGPDDPLRFRITSSATPQTPLTVTWGIDEAAIFVGEFWDDGGEHQGFWAERQYSVENGLWSYTYHPLEYPGGDPDDPGFPDGTTVATASWDSVRIGGLLHVVGRHTDMDGSRGHVYNQPADSWAVIDYPGAAKTFPTGINTNGEVVGYYMDDAGDWNSYHGFICAHTGTGYVPIDVPGAVWTKIYRINNNGMVLGQFMTPQGETQGFTLDLDSGFYSRFKVDGAAQTWAYGFNDSGRVTGVYQDATGAHAFIGGPFAVPGDVDGSGGLNLADAVISLQIVTGQPAAVVPERGAAVSGDRQIGLDEAVYIIQELGASPP